MNLTHVPAAAASHIGAARHAGPLLRDVSLPAVEALDAAPGARDHAALIEAYRPTGGIACADDLARLLEYLDRGDFISLARHIAARTVFGFTWRERLWIPMFQFELRDMSVQRSSQAVLAELSAAFDGWSLACWFAEPNPGLGGQRPVDRLHDDCAAVCAAARADRFALQG
jgi:hypothetical protein